MNPRIEELAKLAYETGIAGVECVEPAWGDLADDHQAHWIEIAHALYVEVMGTDGVALLAVAR